MNFEIPLKRQPKQEKYSFPVLTMQRQPEEKGGARRFLLNKAAFEFLGFNPDKKVNETLSIGFPQNNNGNFVIAVTTDNINIPDRFKYMLHKSGNSFSDLTLYNAIKREMDITLVTDDIEFRITRNGDVNTLHVITDNVGTTDTIMHKSIAEAKHEEADVIENHTETEQVEEEHELKLN